MKTSMKYVSICKDRRLVQPHPCLNDEVDDVF